MQSPLDARTRTASPLRPLPLHKGRWMVNEYPAGYVAQLARPHAGKAERGAAARVERGLTARKTAA
jgi:hypothetical protein